MLLCKLLKNKNVIHITMTLLREKYEQPLKVKNIFALAENNLIKKYKYGWQKCLYGKK